MVSKIKIVLRSVTGDLIDYDIIPHDHQLGGFDSIVLIPFTLPKSRICPSPNDRKFENSILLMYHFLKGVISDF